MQNSENNPEPTGGGGGEKSEKPHLTSRYIHGRILAQIILITRVFIILQARWKKRKLLK